MLVDGALRRGARFRLPLAARRRPRSRGPPSRRHAPAVLAGTRVLVVEDDVDVAALLESALGARGAKVVVARTAAELARRARRTARRGAGRPVAHRPRRDAARSRPLRRGSPDVALVFISGSAVGLPEGFEGERAVRWVRKPFEVGEIVAALTETRAVTTGARTPFPGKRSTRRSDPV